MTAALLACSLLPCSLRLLQLYSPVHLIYLSTVTDLSVWTMRGILSGVSTLPHTAAPLEGELHKLCTVLFTMGRKHGTVVQPAAAHGQETSEPAGEGEELSCGICGGLVDGKEEFLAGAGGGKEEFLAGAGGGGP